MREELRNYFDEFKDRGEVDGERVRSLLCRVLTRRNSRFRKKRMTIFLRFSLVMDETESLLDTIIQLTVRHNWRTKMESPSQKWAKVKTTAFRY